MQIFLTEKGYYATPAQKNRDSNHIEYVKVDTYQMYIKN